jgi:lysyl-tRNA synthetase class II
VYSRNNRWPPHDIRRQGKASFVTMVDETSKIQLFSLDAVGEEAYTFIKKWGGSGDIL